MGSGTGAAPLHRSVSQVEVMVASAGDVLHDVCLVCGQGFEYVAGPSGRRRKMCSEECRVARRKEQNTRRRKELGEEMRGKYRTLYANMKAASRGHAYTKLSVGVARRGFRAAIAAVLRRVPWENTTPAEIKEIVSGLEYGEDFPSVPANRSEPEVPTGR